MADALVKKRLQYPASRVWELLGNFGDISWVDGFDRVEQIGEGVGMVRRIIVSDELSIDERLTAFDEGAMSFSYDFPAGIPFQMTDYRVDAKITPLDDSSCEVQWHARAEPDGVTEQQAEETMRGLYAGLLDNLQAYLSAHPGGS